MATSEATHGGTSLFAVPDDLIRVIDAAAILGVSHQRVNQLRAEGKLSPVDVSGMGHTRILYRRSEVERLRRERGVGRYGRTWMTWFAVQMLALGRGLIIFVIFVVAMLAIWWAIVALVVRSSRRKDREDRS